MNMLLAGSTDAVYSTLLERVKYEVTRMGGSQDDAEDALQNSWVYCLTHERICAGWKSEEHRDNFIVWKARKCYIDTRRARIDVVEFATSDDGEEDTLNTLDILVHHLNSLEEHAETADPSVVCDDEEAHHTLVAAIHEYMNVDEAEITLLILEGYTFQEIGVILGKKPNTVHRSYTRGVAKLKVNLWRERD